MSPLGAGRATPIDVGDSGAGWTTLPIVGPVGNQVVQEQRSAAAAATRQAQQSVQLTDYTYIQQTDGVGVGAFTVMFDVVFTQEPVVSHGMTLPNFAAEVRADVDAAAAAEQAATTNANAYAWHFDNNMRIETFRPVNDAITTTDSTIYEFRFAGIVNNTNNNRRMELIVTGQDGKEYLAKLGGHTALARADAASSAAKDFSTGRVTVRGVNQSYTWQLLADGRPLASIDGLDIGTTHPLTTLSQEEINARKGGRAAGAAVGDALALGGNVASYPLCAVYVKRWLLDAQNNYIGADCIVVVKTFGAAAEPTPTIPGSGGGIS